jgi:maltose alpha-D-glucosyltransferase/alpha-amylase
VQDESRHTLDLLARRRGQWAEPLAALAARVLDAAPKLGARMARAAAMAPAGVKTRLHGDLHLGQVLIRQDDFVFIDFEGEPQRPLEERRAKHCALRDVAGMLRSFDYARHTALHQTTPNAAEIARLGPAAREWERQVRAAFLQTYGEVAVEGGLYTDPAAFEAASPLLDLFELEKALYELRYEMDNRPDWVAVPLAGIAALAGIPD